ncbi:MAG: glycosyltransferase family 39 protein [bacterium]|nr:glycosyltransferase family 39 protein [bacterium]
MEKKRCCLCLLLAILIIAGFLRFWQLDLIPPGLYPDVAINGNDALNALKTGDFKVFYPENNGREGLFINLIAFSFAIFGPSVWAIKVVAAIIGTLTVLGLYLLTKEIFVNTKYEIQNTKYKFVPLLATFLFAASFWHLNFSRLGFRAIMVPFFLVFSFYFLFKSLNGRKVFPAVLAGIFFGLGFHTYIAFRVAPLLLPLVFIPFYFVYRKEGFQKKYFLLVLAYLAAVFIAALPIGLYFLNNPQDFMGRAAGVSIFAAANPIKESALSLIKHLTMFVFIGDGNWRHNFANSPQLPAVLGIIMYLGIVFILKQLALRVKEKKWQEVAASLLLIGWFFTLLLPGILTAEGTPHALRTIGVLPVAYIFVGFGLFWLKEILKQRRMAFLLILFVALFFGIFFDPLKYFVVWAKNSHVKGAFTENYVEIGKFLNSLPENVSKYVVVNESGTPVPWPSGIPMPAQTPIFFESIVFGNPQATYLLPEELSKIMIDREKTVVVIMKEDQELFGKLEEKFPFGRLKEYGGVWRFEID